MNGVSIETGETITGGDDPTTADATDDPVEPNSTNAAAISVNALREVRALALSGPMLGGGTGLLPTLGQPALIGAPAFAGGTQPFVPAGTIVGIPGR